MLKLKIDKIPYGTDKQKTISEMQIINTVDHEQRPRYGNYIVHHEGGSFMIDNHDRESDIWSLAHKAIYGYLYTDQEYQISLLKKVFDIFNGDWEESPVCSDFAASANKILAEIEKYLSEFKERV